jgi:hypothetical protein
MKYDTAIDRPRFSWRSPTPVVGPTAAIAAALPVDRCLRGLQLFWNSIAGRTMKNSGTSPCAWSTVHAILGRHRDDDPRIGWISGLDEEEGGGTRRSAGCGSARN